MTTGSLLPDGSRSRWDQRDKNKYCYGVLLSRRCVTFLLEPKQRHVKRKLRKLFFLHRKSYSHHKRCKKTFSFFCTLLIKRINSVDSNGCRIGCFLERHRIKTGLFVVACNWYICQKCCWGLLNWFWLRTKQFILIKTILFFLIGLCFFLLFFDIIVFILDFTCLSKPVGLPLFSF